MGFLFCHTYRLCLLFKRNIRIRKLEWSKVDGIWKNQRIILITTVSSVTCAYPHVCVALCLLTYRCLLSCVHQFDCCYLHVLSSKCFFYKSFLLKNIYFSLETYSWFLHWLKATVFRCLYMCKRLT